MRLRPRSLLVVAAVALTATAAPPAATASAAPAPGTGAPAPARTVVLPTGDAVTVSGPADRVAISIVPRDRTGAAGQFRTFRSGDRVTVVPAVALPYVGRQLDPALFDVTALARNTTGRLPVRISWAAGATRHAIPGVTVTSSSGGTDTGHLTPGSARRFGAALAEQVRTRSSGLLAGVAAIRYAGPLTPVATPRFPMFTLRIPLIDETGAPAEFPVVWLVNTDDARKYAGLLFGEAGEVRVSVPEGNYSLLAEFVSFGEDGTVTDRLVNVSDFAVTGATRLRPVDARTAATEVALTGTPRPAEIEGSSITWTRLSSPGVGLSGGSNFFGSARVFVAPGRPVVHGLLSWSDRWQLLAPDGSYTYDLIYGADGAVPANQRYRATADQLATLTVKYHADVPGLAINPYRFGYRSLDLAGVAFSRDVVAPLTRTEYVGGSQDAFFQAQIVGFQYFDEENFILGDFWYDGYRRHPAGTRDTIEWRRAPLHTSLDVDTGAYPAGFFFCPACRYGDTIGLFLTPLEDTEPGHYGGLDAYGDTPVGRIDASTRLRVWRAGTLLTDLADFYGTELEVPAGDARFRVRYDQSRQAPWIRYGTRMTTEWTFRSGTTTTRTAPESWSCEGPCAILPLLTASYAAPVDLLNTVAPGPGTVRVTLRPTQGAPPVPVDEATVSWSADDGVTWASAPVRSLGDGTFAATVPNPAGTSVSLRIGGTDRTGNTISQTLIRAYGVRS